MPKGSILVVDDEIEIREGLEALLTSESFDVTLAETGEAGLRQQRRELRRASFAPGQHRHHVQVEQLAAHPRAGRFFRR